MAALGVTGPLPDPEAVGIVGIVGAGTIGASWTAWFLARGCRVLAYDIAPGFFDRLREHVKATWPALQRTGVATIEVDCALKRLAEAGTIEAAVRDADVVQESAPERLDLKRDILAEIDANLSPNRIVASSTSGFGVSQLQSSMRHPQRLVIGHPFNPPHLIPLVEVVGGGLTSEDAIQWALKFYVAIGKKPIRVRKEIPGHLANRLQAALWREAVYLVAEDIASVADVDAAIAFGPGLRWAIMGPHLVAALAGGANGMTHYLDHLGGVVEEWWGDLGTPHLTDQVRTKLIAGAAEEIMGRSMAELTQRRDDLLIGILSLLEQRRF
jgi:carnitine 3-dehydrogenase